ncbi:MAG: acetyl-CoA carboxylase biotin carboxylase subunit [Planctomycetota bacterium]
MVGTPLFDKILIANRGEIALRVIRACHELGIQSAAVYSEADRSALHVREANEAYLIGPPPAARSYLDGDKIIAAAKACGAQAIHPGYGFLSENGAFASAVEQAGLVFIGPTGAQIRAMGDKIEARRLMQRIGVPVTPGTQAAIDDLAALRRTAADLGYPVMIKATGGGGGKGIRIVGSPDELQASFERAQSEAASAFKNPAVYLEKLIDRPHHIEFQILGDGRGKVVQLGERECSIQRRHQKVIEECPSPFMTPELRAAMGKAAVQAAAAIQYRNAGTIEFLVDAERRFFFLEMNTRLQVEHPITEEVTGVDLVREQLLIAAGQPLTTPDETPMRGHAIEARICAEDPDNNFAPAIGTVSNLDLPGGRGVRVDGSLYEGMEVSVHYDPLLAKLIVRGNDREQAVARMRRALTELRLTGVHTNIAFLLGICETDAFARGLYHTGFIDEQRSSIARAPSLRERRDVALAAAVLRTLAKGQAAAAGNGAGGASLDPWTFAARREQLRI